MPAHSKKEYMREWVRKNKNRVKEYRDKTADNRNARRRELYAQDEQRRKDACRAANEYRLKHPEQRRNQELNKMYGITRLEYNAMIDLQGNRCAICGNELTVIRQIHVDHDHKTGKVRGILCGQCNMAIGKFHDNTNILQRAINYLLKRLQ